MRLAEGQQIRVFLLAFNWRVVAVGGPVLGCLVNDT